MAVEGLQIFGQINNPLEPPVKPGPAPTLVDETELDDEMLEEPQEEGLVGKVSPESARYFGPEGRCANCVHFMEPGSCEIVAGEIAADGICSLFSQDEMPIVEEPVA